MLFINKLEDLVQIFSFFLRDFLVSTKLILLCGPRSGGKERGYA
jgi:hypothetical protein